MGKSAISLRFSVAGTRFEPAAPVPRGGEEWISRKPCAIFEFWLCANKTRDAMAMSAHSVCVCV